MDARRDDQARQNGRENVGMRQKPRRRLKRHIHADGGEKPRGLMACRNDDLIGGDGPVIGHHARDPARTLDQGMDGGGENPRA